MSGPGLSIIASWDISTARRQTVEAAAIAARATVATGSAVSATGGRTTISAVGRTGGPVTSAAAGRTDEAQERRTAPKATTDRPHDEISRIPFADPAVGPGSCHTPLIRCGVWSYGFME